MNQQHSIVNNEITDKVFNILKSLKIIGVKDCNFVMFYIFFMNQSLLTRCVKGIMQLKHFFCFFPVRASILEEGFFHAYNRGQ